MLNIFISYARKDARELAFWLREALQAAGFSVWVDLSEIQGGDVWMANIETAIDRSDVILALMSPAASDSAWCRAETMRGLRKGKRLIPIKASPHAEPPLHLEPLNHVDFSAEPLYRNSFSDLLSDLRAQIAFMERQPSKHSTPTTPQTHALLSATKRNAPAFRRYLRDVRAQAWGDRHWWPYFLFAYRPFAALPEILAQGALHARGGSRWERFVRLYFRPRTPDFWEDEGMRPDGKGIALPAYLLFDLEALLVHPDSRFSDGDPNHTKTAYSTPQYFRELPFELIYHDSWFSADEREEVMRYREAQVLMLDKVGLESLQFIWLRSNAEYETLHHLMPPALWRQWRDKITVRADFHVFNRRRPYVQEAQLFPGQLALRFNPHAPSEPLPMRLHLRYADENAPASFTLEELRSPIDPWALPLPSARPYHAELYFYDQLVYQGQSRPQQVLV